MSKESRFVEIPLPPFLVFNTVGGVLAQEGVPVFRREGWTLWGQETFSPFKMGFPAKVAVTITGGPYGGSHVTLDGENFGWGLNTIHLRHLLGRLTTALLAAAEAIPTPTTPLSTAAPPRQDTLLPPIVRTKTPDDPPRINEEE